MSNYGSTKPAPLDLEPATQAATQTGSAPRVAPSDGDPTTPSERYEVTGKLGAGGLGVVLEAFDSETRRVVAIKLPRRGGAEADTDAALVPEESATRTDPLLDRFAVEARVTLVGDFGEVYLADWGIARLAHETTLSRGKSEPPRARSADATGQVGTPGYMAPELITADWKHVDHRVDLFALGVVLYEVLTGTHPFRREAAADTLVATYGDEPKRPSDIAPGSPLLLEDLCLALLAKDPAARPSSAETVALRIEECLEGAKESERRAAEARTLCEKAKEPVASYHELAARRARLEAEAKELLKPIRGFEPIEKKRPGWALEDLADAAEREQGLALAQAIDLYTKALGYDAACKAAHDGLAQLYFSRAQEATEQRKAATQLYYETLVAQHDQGAYTALLNAPSSLSITSNRSGAQVVLERYVERDRILVPSERTSLGVTPLRNVSVGSGSYLLTLERDGFRKVRRPIALSRGASVEAKVNLYTDDEIGEGFVFVPGGVAILGGDEDAYNATPREERHIEDYAIARVPVSFREYCTFLDEVQRENPALALKRAPHDLRGSEGMAVVRSASGHWEPYAELIEGDALKLFPREEGHFWEVAVILIDWFDARAFCRWSSQRAGVELRLPTEAELEKAARGVDGRFYPWGDRFDPTFCHMNESRGFIVQPEPRGGYAADESPYGVRDLAGNVREWAADVDGERSAAELDAETEPDADAMRGDSTTRRVRSGARGTDKRWCRAASRSSFAALMRGPLLGFRLAKTLTPKQR